MEEIVDRTWVISDDDGEIYAEAEANGASVFVLSNKKRAAKFNATKRAGFLCLHCLFYFYTNFIFHSAFFAPLFGVSSSSSRYFKCSILFVFFYFTLIFFSFCFLCRSIVWCLQLQVFQMMDSFVYLFLVK